MRVKRKASIASVDPVEDNRSVCNNCYQENCITKLVPYDKDSSMKICPVCKFIVKKNQMRFESVTSPLGSLDGKSPTFEVVSKRRQTRVNRGNDDTFNVKDYPLAGKEDSDLRHFANQGFIVSVQDSGNDETGYEEF